jgi:hypothetical protein
VTTLPRVSRSSAAKTSISATALEVIRAVIGVVVSLPLGALLMGRRYTTAETPYISPDRARAGQERKWVGAGSRVGYPGGPG